MKFKPLSLFTLLVRFVSFHAKASNELLVIDLQKVFCVRFIARGY